MKFGNPLQIALLALPAWAILPEARLMNNDQESALQIRHSLPNLLKVDDVKELSADWDIRGTMELDAGRLLVKEGQGSVWSRNPLPNSKDEWTVDLVFRNSEREEVDDHTFYDTNGLSFWLLDGNIPQDTSNFGGPKRFDGLQFLMNNLDYKGLKIFANDGSKDVVNSEANALGGCKVDYLDSSIPFTIRVSYSASKNWFKVQIDNNLCFSTDALSFRNVGSNLLLGVSASTNPISKEYWEILGMDIYTKLSEDAVDDHGVAGEAAPKVVTLTKVELAQPTSRPQDQQRRLSLMERMMANQAQAPPNAQPQQQQQAQTVQNLDKFDSSLADIASKLTLLEETVNAFDLTKMIDLSEAIQGIKQIQSQQSSVLGGLKNTYENFEKLLASHYKEMTESVRSINKEVVEEIRKHRSEVLGISNKVDLLMDNHKEIQSQYQPRDKNSADSELFGTIVKWVLIPLIIGIVAVIVVVYRLKKDIKHSKLL
ncbi:hypothetical protein JCM33374_g2506 [Metschnikowia sp. JCM 33374]|nr:hypothetical protein JCM33374_g2506 [Metschnikowia sp. JCM 33374]